MPNTKSVLKTLPPLVKWSGSKRSQAQKIVSFFPQKIDTYFEPFLGGGSVLGTFSPSKAICGDICSPLIDIWDLTKTTPEILSEEYEKRWSQLQDKGHLYYYKIRDSFNKKQNPHDLLFISRTCVNGLIRFNSNGDFNNSFHHSRKGIRPLQFKEIITAWSKIIKNYRFLNKDYQASTAQAKKGDFIYLDPPYFNTRGRYFGGIDFKKFVNYLEGLNKRNINFALSFDGKRGNKSFIVEIPKNIYKRHLLLHSGNASFNKLQNNKIEPVYESLYLNF